MEKVFFRFTASPIELTHFASSAAAADCTHVFHPFPNIQFVGSFEDFRRRGDLFLCLDFINDQRYHFCCRRYSHSPFVGRGFEPFDVGRGSTTRSLYSHPDCQSDRCELCVQTLLVFFSTDGTCFSRRDRLISLGLPASIDD